MALKEEIAVHCCAMVDAVDAVDDPISERIAVFILLQIQRRVASVRRLAVAWYFGPLLLLIDLGIVENRIK